MKAMRITIGVILGFCILLPSSLAAQTAAVAAPAAMIKPGDVVRVTVWRKPELSGEFEVAADGSIRHPLYQAVQVAGVPLPTAEARMQAFLEQYETNPSFVIEPLFRIAVSGEVRLPSVYTLSPEVTVAQAISHAGGLTDRSMIRRVRLFREDQELIVDLTRPDEGLGQLPIRSGDQIVVDQRRSVFREYVAPVASIAGALASILNVYLRNR
jgi:polysaccharide export outer membrane protein